MRKMLILTGEGIECEKEAMRFFSSEPFSIQAEYCPVPKLLRGEIKLEDKLSARDWLFFPGGFSYSDHYGSGKLLAYKLREAKIFDKALTLKLNLLGNCNGFQVLCEADLFGKNVKLEHNLAQNKSIGFVNRWVKCQSTGPLGSEEFMLPVRHGEGRLLREGAWNEGITPFLRYADEVFENGSVDKVAGLKAKRGESVIWGMMPHPEISLRPLDNPDAMGPESVALHRSKLDHKTGDGVRLMSHIFQEDT